MRAQEKLTELLAPPAARRWTAVLPVVQTITNVARKLRLIERAPNLEALCDYLSELRYAAIFRSLGFDVEAEPLGGKGPDFRLRRDGREAMLECTRFRRVRPGPAVLSLTDPLPRLVEYGDLERDTQKAFSKIIDKFPQTGGFEALVAVWNDDGDLEELEIGEAVDHIRTDVAAGRYCLPQGLQAVVYGSPWSDVATGKQVFCFELVPAVPPISEWLVELRGLGVDEALADLASRCARSCGARPE